jgi:hypothetical protein
MYDKYHRDRYDYDRQALTAEALRAFRLNPLARRIVKLYRQFSIGTNVSVEVADNPKAKRPAKSRKGGAENFIRQFWNHPVNKLDEQIAEWFDECTVTGTIVKHCAATDETATVNIPIMIPSNSIGLQGAKLASIEIDYEILVAACDAVDAIVNL